MSLDFSVTFWKSKSNSTSLLLLNIINLIESLLTSFNKSFTEIKSPDLLDILYGFPFLYRILNLDIADNINLEKNKFYLNEYEKKILRKIFDWPKVVETASTKYEPHKITFYLYDLSTLFHSYWSKGNENEEYKFIVNNKIKNLNTLAIIKLVALVVENGMKILGVSLPKKM